MSDEELSELERLVSEGTPGPWSMRTNDTGTVIVESAPVFGSPGFEYAETVMDNETYYPAKPSVEDMLLCAAARNAVPVLIDEVRRLRAALEEKEVTK